MRRAALAALVLFAVPAHAAPIPAMALAAIEAPSPSLSSTRAAAREAWRQGDLAAAAEIAREYLRDLPAPEGPTRDLVLLQSAHFGGLGAPAHGALPADAETIDGLVELGWFLARGGDHRAAIDLLEAVLVKAPDHAEAHLLVAESRAALGHRDDAVRHSEIYLALTADVPQS